VNLPEKKEKIKGGLLVSVMQALIVLVGADCVKINLAAFFTFWQII